jgi:hypothetical protein
MVEKRRDGTVDYGGYREQARGLRVSAAESGS